MEEILTEKGRQRIFLYDTKSPDYRAKAWDGMGKELKIKRKFYVSSRDVRMCFPCLTSPLFGLHAFQVTTDVLRGSSTVHVI